MRFSEKPGSKKAYRAFLRAEDGHTEQRTGRKPRPRHSADEQQVFKCRHCKRFVTPPLSGGRHRNHCPFCLYSRHVDGKSLGDRMSDCGASMEPIGYFQRVKGEYVLVHRCLKCAFERFNRIAADDHFDLLLSLPEVEARTRNGREPQQCGIDEASSDSMSAD